MPLEEWATTISLTPCTAVLRRVREHAEVIHQEQVMLRGLFIDRGNRTVKLEGRTIDLTAREFDLLWILVGHPNRVFSRDQLLNLVWRRRTNCQILKGNIKVIALPGFA